MAFLNVESAFDVSDESLMRWLFIYISIIKNGH